MDDELIMTMRGRAHGEQRGELTLHIPPVPPIRTHAALAVAHLPCQAGSFLPSSLGRLLLLSAIAHLLPLRPSPSAPPAPPARLSAGQVSGWHPGGGSYHALRVGAARSLRLPAAAHAGGWASGQRWGHSLLLGVLPCCEGRSARAWQRGGGGLLALYLPPRTYLVARCGPAGLLASRPCTIPPLVAQALAGDKAFVEGTVQTLLNRCLKGASYGDRCGGRALFLQLNMLKCSFFTRESAALVASLRPHAAFRRLPVAINQTTTIIRADITLPALGRLPSCQTTPLPCGPSGPAGAARHLGWRGR